MSNKQRLELTWIGKEKTPRLEPRILLEDMEKSHHAENRVSDNDIFDNKLIFGDNLLALKSLEQDYTGKVKCIYIDPPYNTGSAFEHYDDGIEHSLWLGLMRDRLELLRNLLAGDGVIFVQIDKNEMAYLKVIMDEIFGRKNFITTIAIRMSKTSGFKIEHADKTIVKNTEYIHVYSKTARFALKPQYEAVDYDSHYSYILKEKANCETITQLIDDNFVSQELNKYNMKKSSKFLVDLYKISKDFRNFVFKNKNLIGRTHTAPSDALKNKDNLFLKLKNEKHVVNFTSKTGENYLIKKTKNSLNQYIPINLKFNMVDTYDSYEKRLSNILGDWWDDFYLDMGNVENEGGVFFKASKKPERLLFRILNMFTSPGDLVLDSFAGSGTTGAVAHKMGRRWIMIELGDHCHTHIAPRLQKVIDGTDQGGISKAVNWKGGGGFRYYRLAPSLLERDCRGRLVINDAFNPAMLAEALCKMMGFTYAPSEDYYWEHGYSTESDFIYVTTQTLDQEQLEALSEEVGEQRSLLVCCSAFRAERDDYFNLTLQKIPNVVLKNCEWGRDDYSLNVQNLPATIYKEKEHNLFGEEL